MQVERVAEFAASQLAIGRRGDDNQHKTQNTIELWRPKHINMQLNNMHMHIYYAPES